ncbi:MAG TPA: hypothetical protein EYP22_07780 [Methanosarcinales archaeon]|nr:hypothetical protein [Methanosarcinales archaeon]
MKYKEQVKKIHQAYKMGPLELTISDEVFVDREDTADLLFKLAKRARLRDAISVVFQENNPNEEIKVWCVSKSGFTKEALLLAKKNGIYTTGLEQLNYFFRRFVLGVI